MFYQRSTWKNDPRQWPVSQLQLGNTTYNRRQLLSILEQPIHGNGWLPTGSSGNCRKFNIVSGGNGSCIQQTLVEVDTLIGDLVIPPVGNQFLRPSGAARTLATQYNSGALCAPACNLPSAADAEFIPFSAAAPRHHGHEAMRESG